MDQLPQLTEEEFEHIEEEIARTSKGRSFLRRFRRRAQGAATEEIRTMLEEFRLSWRQQSQVLEAANRVHVLRQELIEMAASIERARREIAALQPADVDKNKITSATSELDAIVISTERASFEILNSAERLLELSSRFRDGGADADLCASLETEVSSIFTACSFQDLTGQRTSKVVNVLRYIEQRINAVITIWGASQDLLPIPDDFVDTREDAHLLEGPQLEGKGVSQQDVDRMFDEPDAPAARPPHPPAPPPAKPAEAGGASYSQADIDALMSGAPPAKPAKPAGPPQSQSDIDALFDAPAPKPAPPAKPAKPASPPQSQSDIDALFDAPAPKPAPPAKPAKPASPPQSQSDIDALFDAPAPKPAGPPQSQSDIDALFDAPAPKPAAKAAPPPPPRAAETKPKPRPKAPEPAATASPLDQSAIDALFG